MGLKNSLNYINKFKSIISLRLRDFYLNSSFYNKKISKLENKNLIYKPNTNIFYCIVKYFNKKEKIENFKTSSIWKIKNINNKDYRKLNNFFWLYSVNLKSSSKITQSIINNWIDLNTRYNRFNWETDILSKRIMSWLSNSSLTYENGSEHYKEKFNFIIRKQVTHLKNEIDRSLSIDNKIVGCAAIILTGLSYKDDKFINYGLNLLRKIILYSFDDDNFPKTRNFRQLVFYLKYFVLIRELLKDSQSDIPEYLDEIIFYLGQNYNFFWQETKHIYLFNGSHENDYKEFDEYLLSHGYKFNSQKNEIGNYVLMKNSKNSLMIDVGGPPERKFSYNYQSGVLSFELTYLQDKLICNSGYFQNPKHQLNKISKTTAAHSTLVINNSSISKFKIDKNGLNSIDKTFKVFDKKIVKEKKRWFIEAKHDGYLKEYGALHQRTLEFLPENFLLNGFDKIIAIKLSKKRNFEIRFHLYPGVKATRTIDGKTILIEVGNSGWKFFCDNYFIDIETGLYFGKKNSYIENQNICIFGETDKNIKEINWVLKKI